jgi:hypothetical protein
MENGKKESDPREPERMRDFTDLETWRLARRLLVETYRVSGEFRGTRLLDSHRKFGTLKFRVRKLRGRLRALLISGEYSVLSPEPPFCL